MRTFIVSVYLLLFSVAGNSQTGLQRTWSNWVSSPYGVTFRFGGQPQDFFTVSSGGGIGFPFFSSPVYNGATAVAYSDSITGQVKFIATPTAVYNRNYDTVTNGYDLISCGSDGKHSVLVIPFPDGQNKFYIIHQFPSSSLNVIPGLQTRCSVYSHMTGNTPGIRYSVLDMDYNNGLGRIISKNIFLPGAGGEKFAQIRHANGKDLWLVGHAGNGNIIARTLFHQTGIQGFPYTIVNFPTLPATSTFSAGGNIEASPKGDKISITAPNSRLVNLYHFNKATGDVTFDASLTLPDFASELCFSPDGTKLYASTYAYSNCGNSMYRLYQFDLGAANRQQSLFEIFSDPRSSGFRMQRVHGNRILVHGRYQHYDFAPTELVYHAIANPNQPQSACTFQTNVFISLATNANMPNLPNDLFQQDAETPITNFNFPKDTAVCFGTYTLAAPAGYAEYRWNTGQTTQAITVTQPGSYSVVAGPTGFTRPAGYGFTTVSAKSLPLDLGPDTTLCPKSVYQISIPSHFNYVLWQDGDTSRNRRVAFPGGKQVVHAIDVNGCRTSDSVCVRINYYPRAEFGNDTTLCAGEKLTLRMEPTQLFYNTACLWQDGSTKDSFRVTAPGIYWGRATYQGCTVSDTIRVNYINPVTINLGRDTALCAGDSILLSVAQSNLTYQWNTGATTQSILVKAPGTYIVRASNGQCTLADTIVVTYKQRPQFNLGPDKAICPYESTNLTAPIAGTYLWSNGSTNNSIQVTQPGLYWLRVTVNGCDSRDTVVVTHKPMPVVELGNDTTLCEGSTKTLNVFNQGATYLWFNGSTSESYTITQPVTAYVAVNLNGCIKRDTITVGYNKPPHFTLGNDTVLCSGTSIVLQPPLQRGNYQWQNGSSGTSFTVTTPGVYSLQVTNECGAWTDSVRMAATLCELLMPNAFTPNGDGLNDLFLVKFTHFLKSFKMTVFDRRGELLYQTSTPGQGWDGTYKGKALPIATYVWKIEYTDIWGTSETKWGTVTLIR